VLDLRFFTIDSNESGALKRAHGFSLVPIDKGKGLSSSVHLEEPSYVSYSIHSQDSHIISLRRERRRRRNGCEHWPRSVRVNWRAPSQTHKTI